MKTYALTLSTKYDQISEEVLLELLSNSTIDTNFDHFLCTSRPYHSGPHSHKKHNNVAAPKLLIYLII